jgi:Recombination endonuclease VII
MKQCKRCGLKKPLFQFYFNICKTCSNRRSSLKKKYGISWDNYVKLKANQGDCCAICKQTIGKNNKIHVDHSHTTGLVRGLLCSGCNIGLGHFKENIESLKSAALYLEKYNLNFEEK